MARWLKERSLGRKAGMTIWLTGLPCAGKSTLAREIEKRLHSLDVDAIVLDGDEI